MRSRNKKRRQSVLQRATKPVVLILMRRNICFYHHCLLMLQTRIQIKLFLFYLILTAYLLLLQIVLISITSISQCSFLTILRSLFGPFFNDLAKLPLLSVIISDPKNIVQFITTHEYSQVCFCNF